MRTPTELGLLLLVLISASACSKNPPVEVVADTADRPPTYNCGRGGFLRAEMVGALSLSLDWGAESMSCEGMPRPEGAGARLRFAGPGLERDKRLAVIIALPELSRGATGRELATNATVMIEGSGRFFSTSADDICWTDVVRQEPLSDDRYAIAGTFYCIAPLAEINGDGSLTIAELSFSGLLDWSAT